MSNQFLIFSKIQINNPEQYQTCFSEPKPDF
jgi:hypothetical protein